MDSEGYLMRLSTEVLLKIFSYVDVTDLCRLRQTCKRFNEVINSWDHLLLKDVFPLVTNQVSSIFLSRCQQRLPIFEKIRISENWRTGRYSEKALAFDSKGRGEKYRPYLHLTSESVWLGLGSHIYCYERNNTGVNLSSPKADLHGSSSYDVEQFQMKNNLLLSGHGDGTMWLASVEDGRIIFDRTNCHEFNISSVDMSPNGDTIVSSSINSSVKVWTVDYNSDEHPLKESCCRFFDDIVLRICLSDDRPLIAVGMTSDICTTSLVICDIERISDPPKKFSQIVYGPGVIDLRWDGPHTLWSCGFDNCLRRWDVRTGTSVQDFYDPQGSRMYCLDCDYHNTIMAGTEWYGQVNLWDVRHPECIQVAMIAVTLYKTAATIDAIKRQSGQVEWLISLLILFQLLPPLPLHRNTAVT